MTVDQIHSPTLTNDPKEEFNLTSDDVGLIFAREYYTFLNKKPSRLHAFYGCDSLLVRGDEGESSLTFRGQEEIRLKFKQLDFENCKVLVTQVDSQASANNGVLVNVLGEISNKDMPSQKFTETFFLAPQRNGYYVLNNIFRFLKDKVDIDYYSCVEQEEHGEDEPYYEQEVSLTNGAKDEDVTVEEEAQPVQKNITNGVAHEPINSGLPPVIDNKHHINEVTQETKLEATVEPEKNKEINGRATDAENNSGKKANGNNKVHADNKAKINNDVKVNGIIKHDKANGTDSKNIDKFANIKTNKSAEAKDTKEIKDDQKAGSEKYNKKATNNSSTKKNEEVVDTNDQDKAKLQPEPSTEEKPEITEDKTKQVTEDKKTESAGDKKPNNETISKATTPAAPKTWASLAASNAESPELTSVKAPVHIAASQQPPPPVQQSQAPQQQPTQNTPQSHQYQNNQSFQHHNNRDQQYNRKETQVFVKNVALNMTEELLETAFSKFGTIKSVNFGHQHNCAFVDFESSESTLKALEQHKIILSDNRYVYAEERRRFNRNNQYNNINRYPQQQQNQRKGYNNAPRAQQGNYKRTGSPIGNQSGQK